MALFGRPTEQDARKAQAYAQWMQRRNPFAIASMVLGVFSLIEFGVLIIFGVASIVLGMVALGAFVVASVGRSVVVGVRGRRRATHEAVPTATYRAVRGNPRLYGGLVVHVGVVVVAVALATTSGYTTKREVRLAAGQSATVRGFTVTYLRMRTSADAQKTTIAADVRVRRGSSSLGTFRPAISTYPNFSGGIGTPAIHSDPWHDLYLTLVSAPTTGDATGAVSLGVQVGTFVMWLWIGGLIMLAGIALALTPTRRRRPVVPTAAVRDEPRELAKAAT